MKRFKKLKISLLRLLIIAAFLVIWEVAANVGLVDSFIFSSPTRIVACFQKSLANGAIFRHSAVTLGETFLSFAIIILAGVGIALLLWLSPFFTEVFEPFLVILNSIPKSALAPMLIVWLGNSPKAIIVTAVSVAIFGTIINVYTGFNETDPEMIKLMRTFKSTRRQMLAKLILPASIGTIISNMKVAIGLCLVGVIIGEFLAAKSGLGYLIVYSSQIFAMDTIAMAIIILCILSIVLFKIVDLVEILYKRMI
jgi:NitT/TauT family transport system permease protein